MAADRMAWAPGQAAPDLPVEPVLLPLLMAMWPENVRSSAM